MSINRSVIQLIKRGSARLINVDSRHTSSSTIMMNSSRPFTVVVEGNIGSGKTTFLNHFEKFPGVVSLAEPVNLWRNAKGHNLLDLMYQDPQKNAMAFQSYVQLTMLQTHQARCDSPIKVMERSIHSARHCFVENLHSTGLLSSPDFAVLDQWYRWICNTQDVAADLIIYLYTTPETAMQRIQKRSRNEEKTVSMSYLKTLHELHETWLRSNLPKQITSAPVIEIDANKDLPDLKSSFAKCEAAILSKNYKNLVESNEEAPAMFAEEMNLKITNI